jgi:hypothetical protein
LQSNILANQTTMFWRTRHRPLPKQQASRRSHKLSALDCSCVGAVRSIKKIKPTEKASDPGDGKASRWLADSSQENWN